MTAQAMEALQEANRVRVARAKIKREIAAGELSVPDVLEVPEVARMPLGELLAAQDRWGPRRTVRFLAELDLRPDKQVGSLTERQRGVIAGALGEQGQVAA